jgi:hypothetical protein
MATKGAKWQPAAQAAQIVAAAASSLTLLVALVILYLVYTQGASQPADTDESRARQALRSYLELTQRSPAFAVPDYDSIKRSPRELALYESFVTQLLQTCEEIAGVLDDNAWQPTCRTHIVRHVRYLCDTLTAETIGGYDADNIGEMIVAAAAEAKGKAPECTEGRIVQLRRWVRQAREEE